MPFPRRPSRDGKWQCAACAKWLDADHFHVRRMSSSGLSSRCRACLLEAKAARVDRLAPPSSRSGTRSSVGATAHPMRG